MSKWRGDPHTYWTIWEIVSYRNLKKNSGSFNEIQTHDLCDAGAMLYQLSYEANNNILYFT